MARGIWKGSISFGLLNIPVSMQSSAEGKELHFHMLDKNDLAPINFKRVNANSGKEVSYKNIVKGYELEKGEYVILTDQDFKAANPKATQAIEIEDFVALDEIDTLFFEKPYYLVPQKNGEKGYFLLRDSLKNLEKVAIGKVVLRTKQRLAAIMVKGDYLMLEILRFAHEVKELHEVDAMDEVNTDITYSKREMAMAEQLINGMTAKWQPDKYKDTYYDDLMKRIKAKAKNGEAQLLEDDESQDVKPTSVIDLLPLLQKSLEAKAKSKSEATSAPAKKTAKKSKTTAKRKVG